MYFLNLLPQPLWAIELIIFPPAYRHCVCVSRIISNSYTRTFGTIKTSLEELKRNIITPKTDYFSAQNWDFFCFGWRNQSDRRKSWNTHGLYCTSNFRAWRYWISHIGGRGIIRMLANKGASPTFPKDRFSVEIYFVNEQKYMYNTRIPNSWQCILFICSGKCNPIKMTEFGLRIVDAGSIRFSTVIPNKRQCVSKDKQLFSCLTAR